MAVYVISPANLGRGPVGTTVSSFKTVSDNTILILKDIVAANTSTTDILTLTLYLVPSGDVASSDNVLIPNVEIYPNKVFQWTGTQILVEGDSIQAVASANGITINMGGGESV